MQHERHRQGHVRALRNKEHMQLRYHPQMTAQWPPRRPVGSAYFSLGVQAHIPIEPLSEAAVMHHVADCPPLPPPMGVQGVVLYTDQGHGLIVAPDARLREDLLHTLQACCGWSLREIGDVDINF